MRKLGVVLCWRPDRIAAAQPGWLWSPVSAVESINKEQLTGSVVTLTNDNVSFRGSLDDLERFEVSQHNFNCRISSLEFSGRRAEESCDADFWESLQDSFEDTSANVPG